MKEAAKAKSYHADPELKKRLGSLYGYMSKRLGIKGAPKIYLTHSSQNAQKPFGMTGYYNPDKRSIRVFTTNRHPTDVLRSFAHELIHHWQNENGRLQSPKQNEGAPHYAQNDPVLRQREMEAYMVGNILFRDWQDENRYGPPLTSLNENLTIADYDKVRAQLTAALTELVRSHALKAYHRDATSGDMIASDFIENIVRMLVLQLDKYLQNVNNKGNWENQMHIVK